MFPAEKVRARGYRPDIDGLRAVAVLSVVAFHYGVSSVSGGFTGVDIFFVLSGYLITASLVEDRRSPAHRGVSAWLLGFYRRRILRIVPAMLVMLLAVLVAGWFILMPGDYADLGRSAFFSALGLGNVYFFDSTGYFDRAAELKPLLHMWSLGVEEQFYVVWPMLLLVLLQVSRRSAFAAGVVAALLVAMGFLWAITLAADDMKAAFYLPFARAWELGIGALLVFLPALTSRFWSELLALAGVGLIGWGLFALTARDGFPGFNAIYPCLGAALLIWPSRSKPVIARILALGPLRVVGLLSYGLYLWHWPVLVLFRHHIGGAMPSASESIVLVLLSLGLAFASWRLIERPARSITASALIVVPTGAAAAIGLALLGLAVFRQDGLPQRLPPGFTAMASLETMWVWPCSYAEVLGADLPVACSFGADASPGTTRALLWGDSHAEHMAPYLEAATVGLPVRFNLPARCIAGGDRSVMSLPYYSESCVQTQQAMIRYLQRSPEVKLVVLAAAWSNLLRIPANFGVAAGDLDASFRSGLAALLDSIAAPGRRLVVIADIPQTPMPDPVHCALGGAALWRRPCAPDIIPHAFFEQGQAQVYGIIADVVSGRTDTVAVYPGDALCRAGPCMTSIHGEFLYRDQLHIRRNLTPEARREFADLIGLTTMLEAEMIGVREPDAGAIARFWQSRSKYLAGALLIFICTVMLLPLLAAVFHSIKSPEEAALAPPTFFPHTFSFDHYEKLWNYQAGLHVYLYNSFLTAFLTIAMTLALTVPAGYALARFPIRGKEIVFVFLLMALIIPYQALLTPMFLMFAQWKLTNTIVGLAIVHTAIQVPFSLYVMRNGFEAVPRELEEAGMIDGANSWQLLYSVFLPAVVPSMITVALFAFITSWNEFLGALVMMNRSDSFTLPPVLAASRSVSSLGGTDWGMLQAGVTISIIPCIGIYLLLQRYYVSGFLSGAVK